MRCRLIERVSCGKNAANADVKNFGGTEPDGISFRDRPRSLLQGSHSCSREFRAWMIFWSIALMAVAVVTALQIGYPIGGAARLFAREVALATEYPQHEGQGAPNSTSVA